ncbi:hypothetical protein [Brachybacterium saurashtrense]|uniref:Uncharacterized protein n=1 Tax=Brachybacterium saurashtrense TaxID=556288 RepID=A0A345YKT8_9MICO|nr:hypothetical protein [Brachybacterium saurashtrense]AXK44540.1 hypothetical protein DWV08_02150 [Brachybacterium saurashtrense]RRR23152.1 hypothetical protein DXU92_07280 [Brachybacterium saurashtrense]
MDEHTPPRRGRATARASALGATALLVLSFGPAALALSPSTASAPTVRPALSAPAAAVQGGAAQRVEAEDDAQDPGAR